MNKNLMTVAIGGAFVTPALVDAQDATVQLYGKVTVEYGYADTGAAGRPKTDMFQWPFPPAIGFKGQEQLGRGMAAWFQCESVADVRGVDQSGFCSLNSAIGLKGDWGNVYFGIWDTPFKRATFPTHPGLLGTVYLFSEHTTEPGPVGGQPVTRNAWKRRASGLIYYESPSFSGLQVMAAVSAANATSATNATTAQKPRLGSIAGTYSNGPLRMGAGYEKHYGFGAVGGANDDRAWTIGASYIFMGSLRAGIQYIDQKYEITTTTEARKKNWMIGGDWNFSGPHHLLGAYVKAGDTKGNATFAQVRASGIDRGSGAIVAPGADTGGNLWEILYGYDFSKRTTVRFGYVRVSNDSNAIYSLGGLPPTRIVPGQDQSAWVMYGEHNW